MIGCKKRKNKKRRFFSVHVNNKTKVRQIDPSSSVDEADDDLNKNQVEHTI